jgi:sensor histidine kinase YesM
VIAFFAWQVEAVLGTLQFQLAATRSGDVPPFFAVYPFEAIAALLWVPVSVACLWLAGRWPLGVRAAHAGPHLAGFVILVAARAVIVTTLYRWYGWYPPGVPIGIELLASSLLNNALIYLLLTGLAHAIVYSGLARDRERQASEARLAVLSTQIQPHFLFNSLNTIAAAVPRHPEQAETMIVDLATLLRYSLDRDPAGLVALREELQIAQAYLQIEERRFADRLVVATDIDPTVLQVGIPPFVLQPLLENAVRHGLAPASGPCQLRISAQRVGKSVEIRIEDNGVGADAEVVPGVGLSNVGDRLRQHFGVRGGLTLTPRPGGGVIAVIRLPADAVPTVTTAS